MGLYGGSGPVLRANTTSCPARLPTSRVNPFLRPSRLAKSTFQYLSRSAQTIVRSFALYYPMKFFFRVGLVPFVLGMILVIRWGLLFLIEDPYRSRIPSLVVGAVLLIVAVQIWVVAFLADLQAATRRMLAEARVRDRRRALDEAA